MAIMRGSVLQEEGAARAKVLNWERKEVDKLQELRGGQHGEDWWKINLEWSRSESCGTEGRGRESEFSSEDKETH